MLEQYRVLPASEIAVGHCVILNHVEQPCTKLVAIIVKNSGGYFFAKYMNNAEELRRWHPIRITGEATPVGTFGIEVRTDGKKYWCHQVRNSQAEYGDRKRRYWQENQPGALFDANPDLLNIGKRDKKMSLQEQAKQILPYVQAMAEGKTVQIRDKDSAWTDKPNIYGWDPTGEVMYRIKPEPKYRQYTEDEAQALVGNMIRRTGYPKEQLMVLGIMGDAVIIAGTGKRDFDELLSNGWVWTDDGSPCGVLVEDA